jgi:hypothetical protein
VTGVRGVASGSRSRPPTTNARSASARGPVADTIVVVADTIVVVVADTIVVVADTIVVVVVVVVVVSGGVGDGRS